MTRRRMGRVSKAAVAALAATAVLSGCLGVDTPVRVTGYDAPDPAAAVVSPGVAQVYTTQANWQNVPTFTWNPSSTAPVTGSTTDALPNVPAWVAPTSTGFWNVWAPAVRKTSGAYTLHFSASRAGGAMCIGAARSATAAGPFTAASGKWCDPLGDDSAGQLDPYIFRDTDASVWAYWSRQRSPNGNSEIMVQQLTFDAMNRIGTPKVLLRYSDVTPYVSNLGTSSFIENPAIVGDPYNGYNLLVSIGSWNQPGKYHTFELPCLQRNDQCLPSYGGVLPLAASGSTNTGGASLLTDASPDGNYLVYHANTPATAGGSPGGRAPSPSTASPRHRGPLLASRAWPGACRWYPTTRS